MSGGYSGGGGYQGMAGYSPQPNGGQMDNKMAQPMGQRPQPYYTPYGSIQSQGMGAQLPDFLNMFARQYMRPQNMGQQPTQDSTSGGWQRPPYNTGFDQSSQAQPPAPQTPAPSMPWQAPAPTAPPWATGTNALWSPPAISQQRAQDAEKQAAIDSYQTPQQIADWASGFG